MKTLLVIGTTMLDAIEFMGHVGATGATMREAIESVPRAEVRRCQAIPDELWPSDETWTTWCVGIDGIPTGCGYDMVAVTRAAAARGFEFAATRGGVCWAEPPEQPEPELCVDCGATEGAAFTHDNGMRFHLGCPNGPGGGTLGRIVDGGATVGG